MKKRVIEIAAKVLVAALTAFLTAITTTSCMGYGPDTGTAATKQTESLNDVYLHGRSDVFLLSMMSVVYLMNG